ncbi:hypothetical protein ACFCWY_08550 [Streptomyces sp. NPDC056362]|uniref:hypothetical protein n=1 Tax=unclassified Streptomyces TaxID=2593676 RepID=UPI0035E0CF26
MRTLKSTYDGVTPDLDEEEREALVARARAGVEMRSTYALSSYGQRDAEITLRGYDTEDGEERWAVVHDDPNISDVYDSGDRGEAEAAYESEVRGLAGAAGEDDAPWWTESDVDGVRHARYTLLVERQDDGEWTTVHEAEEHLGCAPDVPGYLMADHCTPRKLPGAAAVIVEEVTRQQAGMNYDAALYQALGWPAREATAQAVRVTVTGVGVDGEETHTEVRQVPESVPTEQEIEDYRRRVAAVDAELAERAAYDAYDG